MAKYLGLRGSKLVALVTLCTSMGFVLIGYDNGLYGGIVANPQFQESFPAVEGRPALLSTIVAIYSVGGWAGCLATAFVGDRLGRRWTIIIGGLITAIGALLQAAAFGIPQLIVGRIVGGVGYGLVISTVPILSSEVSEPKSRGRLATVNFLLANTGSCTVYWVNYGCVHLAGSKAWRIPVILQVVFIIIFSAAAYLGPESPRWLVYKDHDEEALDVISRLKNRERHDSRVQALYQQIRDAVDLEARTGSGKWSHLLLGDDLGSRKRVIIACSTQIFQQLGGINGLFYYETTIFVKVAGFSLSLANLMAGLLATWLVVASFIPMYLIDILGRRKILLSTVTGMSLCFVGIAVALSQSEANHNKAADGIAMTVLFFVYMALFVTGFQAIVFLYPTEVLPLRFRAKGNALSASCQWIFSYAVVEFTPPAIDSIGYKYYIIFAVLNAVWVPLIYLFYPETAGKQLEDIDALFAHGAMGNSLGHVIEGSIREEKLGPGAAEGVEGETYIEDAKK
ncbi:hypothetical protein VTK73DRAFT_7446 [Phialemonium thermophilum]|uniref:Major facilitator superfamily (MFS) profile domain-containing protein n=1 Tax=Phialemonium thermophilum TaxID=223376 RepID=A0ABR3WE80_9PEZI